MRVTVEERTEIFRGWEQSRAKILEPTSAVPVKGIHTATAFVARVPRSPAGGAFDTSQTKQ